MAAPTRKEKRSAGKMAFERSTPFSNTTSLRPSARRQEPRCSRLGLNPFRANTSFPSTDRALRSVHRSRLHLPLARRLASSDRGEIRTGSAVSYHESLPQFPGRRSRRIAASPESPGGASGEGAGGRDLSRGRRFQYASRLPRGLLRLAEAS